MAYFDASLVKFKEDASSILCIIGEISRIGLLLFLLLFLLLLLLLLCIIGEIQGC